MKKLNLKAFELGAGGALTREQLKNILGGKAGSGGDCPQNACQSQSDCSHGSCHSALCPKDNNFYYNYCA